MKRFRFEVFGRSVLVAESAMGWTVFYVGTDGKSRPAKDIVIPANVSEEDIAGYLGDLCHEWATERYPDVRRLD